MMIMVMVTLIMRMLAMAMLIFMLVVGIMAVAMDAVAKPKIDEEGGPFLEPTRDTPSSRAHGPTQGVPRWLRSGSHDAKFGWLRFSG